MWLRPIEVALLEVLRDWDSLVDVSFDVAIERITALVDSGMLRLDRIVRATPTEPPRVSERLRRLLEAIGRPDDAGAGLRAAMEGAGEVNAYLNAEEPWKTLKSDPGRAATVLWTAIQAIAGLRVAFAPYLPFSSGQLGEMLGVGADIPGWTRQEVPAATPLGEIAPPFRQAGVGRPRRVICGLAPRDPPCAAQIPRRCSRSYRFT